MRWMQRMRRRISECAAIAALIGSGCAGSDPEGGQGAIDELVAAHRWRAALEQIDLQLAVTPTAPELLDRRTALLRSLGREREALELVLLRRASASDDAALAYEAGELHAHLGDATAAYAAFADAARDAPDDPRPVVATAALLLAEKPPKISDAEQQLAPWLDGPRASAAARFHHALALEMAGDPTAARAAYERALELAPDDLPALCNAAHLA